MLPTIFGGTYFFGVQRQLNIRGKARISLLGYRAALFVIFCRGVGFCQTCWTKIEDNYAECSNLTNDLAASIYNLRNYVKYIEL